jgi:hypothetical protein
MIQLYLKMCKAAYDRDTCYLHTQVYWALFTVGKAWEQPRCSTTREQTKKMWHICTMAYYSAIKNEVMLLYGTGDHHVNRNKPHSERQTRHVFSDA